MSASGSVGFVTIIDRCRALGIEPHKKLTWPVGDLMQRRFVELHGHQPPKMLRRKTRGTGSHCLAMYPFELVPVIDATIRAVAGSIAAEPPGPSEEGGEP